MNKTLIASLIASALLGSTALAADPVKGVMGETSVADPVHAGTYASGLNGRSAPAAKVAAAERKTVMGDDTAKDHVYAGAYAQGLNGRSVAHTMTQHPAVLVYSGKNIAPIAEVAAFSHPALTHVAHH